jgi:hypothetical protein
MTIYYRRSALLGGKEVFPINMGVKNIGCISSYANDNLMNDPLTLTDEGVFSIQASDRNEKFASERSYYIREKLLSESNLENAVATTFKGKYYLAINNHVYVADSRYRSEVEESTYGDYQYEWYYWENVPVRTWFEYNHELYFGTEDGQIIKFNDTATDFNVPIDCIFESAFLDLRSINVAKTLKRITVISKPKVATEFTLGYVTDEGETDIITKEYSVGSFPKTLQEKENVRGFMFIKFYLKNNTDKKLNFYQIALEYVYSGKYRGE